MFCVHANVYTCVYIYIYMYWNFFSTSFELCIGLIFQCSWGSDLNIKRVEPFGYLFHLYTFYGLYSRTRISSIVVGQNPWFSSCFLLYFIWQVFICIFNKLEIIFMYLLVKTSLFCFFWYNCMAADYFLPWLYMIVKQKKNKYIPKVRTCIFSNCTVECIHGLQYIYMVVKQNFKKIKLRGLNIFWLHSWMFSRVSIQLYGI